MCNPISPKPPVIKYESEFEYTSLFIFEVFSVSLIISGIYLLLFLYPFKNEVVGFQISFNIFLKSVLKSMSYIENFAFGTSSKIPLKNPDISVDVGEI